MRTRDIVTLPQRIYTKLIEVDHAAHAWQCISHVRLCACEPIKRHILHTPSTLLPAALADALHSLFGGRASRSPRRGGRQCGGRAAARSSAADNVCGSSVAAAANSGNIDESGASLWGGVGRHVSSICCSSSSGESSGGCSEAAAAAAASGAGAVRVGGVGRHGRGAAGARALPGWARRGRLHARRLLPKLPLRPPSPPPWPPPAPPGDRTWLT